MVCVTQLSIEGVCVCLASWISCYPWGMLRIDCGIRVVQFQTCKIERS